MKEKMDFISYEYKEVTAPAGQISQYVDCYENFGWQMNESVPAKREGRQATVHMRRDRKLVNKMELTRLQRHFEACAGEIETLERSKRTAAALWAWIAGVLGTAFIAGSTFAVTSDPPKILLCILLAVPGFVGWIVPYFLYRHILARQSRKVQPLIEAKQEEIYGLCERGHSLL